MMKHGKSKLKRFPAVVAAVLLLTLLFSLGASADYYVTDSGLGTQYVSRTFEVQRVIGNFPGLSDLNNPTDLFIDSQDNIYILDSGNGRIVVLNSDGTVNRVISGTFGPSGQALNQPEGLFVDKYGDIFVADTLNGRIVHMSAQGVFIEQFTQPTADTYDTEYPFKPSKVYVDDMGLLYCTNSNDYHGIILIDGTGAFKGYIGATKITLSLTDRLVRTFATQEQQEQLAKETPAYFSNFLINQNFIYATSFWSERDQIQKLTPAGSNIYKDAVYGQKNDRTDFKNLPAFIDLAVDSNGIIYAADLVTSKIYVYDQEGNNLAVFGSNGKRLYCFDTISSVAVNSKNELFVLDRTLNIIQVFAPTDNMRNVLAGTTLYNQGKYEEAEVYWQNVLSYDSTNYLANVGIAKADYRKGDYKTAMDLYYNSLDKTGYSASFYYYRIEVLRQYFGWIFFGILLGVIAILFGIGRLKRLADRRASEPLSDKNKLGIRGSLRLSLLTIFHPIDAFNAIKYNRKKLSFWPPLCLLVLLMAVRLCYIYAVHFPLSDTYVVYADLWQQLAIFFIPLLSWIIVSYAITSIMDGKQTFREAATASMYSFLPYIVFMLPLAGLSHFMSSTEAGLYNILVGIVFAWSIILVLLSTKIMNQYSFGKMVGVTLLIIFGIICLWMLCMLFYIVVFQAVDFFKSVYEEMVVAGNG